MSADAPLTPDGPSARRLLQTELARPEYADHRSWVQRVLEWAQDRLSDLLTATGGTLSSVTLLVVLGVLVALVVVAAARVQRRRGTPADGSDHGGVLQDVTASAAVLRERAARAQAAGDHRTALLDWFRGIARGAEERALLAPRPGRTAYETSTELSRCFPELSGEVAAAATAFDRVMYGAATATAADADQVRRTDERVAASRPTVSAR